MTTNQYMTAQHSTIDDTAQAEIEEFLLSQEDTLYCDSVDDTAHVSDLLDLVVGHTVLD